MGDTKIPAGCKVGTEYYGGLGFVDAKQKQKAEACASALPDASVKTVVKNGSDGLPAYVPEYWFKIVNGK